MIAERIQCTDDDLRFLRCHLAGHITYQGGMANEFLIVARIPGGQQPGFFLDTSAFVINLRHIAAHPRDI